MGRPRKTARKGRMSKAEKQLLEGVDPSVDAGEAAKGLALAFNRTPEALKKAIIDVREGLVERAQEYANIHLAAAKKAAEFGNAKPAEWALENLEFGGERVVSPPVREVGPDNRVLVSINLPRELGGVKAQSGKDLAESTVIDVTPLAISEG